MTAEAVERAGLLILETELFSEAGLHQLAATARMVARDVVDLAEQVEAERSARRALQARITKAEVIFGRSAFHAAVAQCATDAQATAVAKRHVTEPAEIDWPTCPSGEFGGNR